MKYRAICYCAALACLVPSACSDNQVPAPMLAVRGVLAIEQMASPCNIGGFFYFRGACLQQTLPAAGGTFKLATYQGLTLSLAFPKNTGQGKVTIVMGDATGQGDITGRVGGKRFSAYPNPCVKATCPGTAFVYFFFDSSVKVKKLTGYSTLSITNTGAYPGQTCYIAFDFFGRPPGWYPIGSYFGIPSGQSLTIAILFGALDPGPEVNTFAVFCV